MYRCPKCNIELPADARFCARCGFNQTNARMNSAASQPTRQSQSPAPASAHPNLAQTPPVRVIQPTVKQTPPHPGMVAPVRTNTPPKASSNLSIPLRPSAKMAAQQGQQPASASRVPQQAAYRVQPNKGSLTQHYTPNQAAQQLPAQTAAQPLQQILQAGPAKQIGQIQPPLQPLAFQPAPTPTPAMPPSTPPSAPPPNRPPTTPSVPPLTPMTLMPNSPQALHSQSMPPPSGQAALPFGGAMVPMAVAQAQMRGSQGQNGTQGHPESLAATNKAAEHWHKSWVDRQRAEAGPALGITRGQASVPEPLMAMQNSFIRLRAIVLNSNQKKQDSMGFGFWVTVVMMLCLIGGLGTYIFSTYLPSAQLQTKIATTNDGPPAMLTLPGKTTTATVGQTLRVHGDYFGAHNTIIFHLNNQTLHSIHGPVQSSSTGSFDASFSLATTLAGSYLLEASDNQTGKHAFLSLEVLPKPNTSAINTTALSLTNRDGQALTTVMFTIPFGQDATPPRDNVFLHNTSNDAPLQWTAAAITDDDGNWLVLDNAQTGGQIDRSGTATLGISTLATGLKVGKYSGDIVFTVNGTGQVLLPITLQLVEASSELVINPNPLITGIMAGGACLPDTSITLINLSNTPVNWDVQGNSSFDQQHILFDNKTGASGMLMPGDTQVLKISCVGVKLGENLYRVTVYYNGQQTLIPISIRASV